MARSNAPRSMPSTAAGPGWPTWFQTKSRPLKRPHRVPHDAARLLVLRQIRDDPVRGAARRGDLAHDALDARGVDVDHGDLRALAREAQGSGASHARGGRGHDPDLSGQAHRRSSSGGLGRGGLGPRFYHRSRLVLSRAASREREGAPRIVDEEPVQPSVVDALGAQARHHVHEQVVVAVAAVLHQRGLVGDVVREQDLVADVRPRSAPGRAPCARRRSACRSSGCTGSRSSRGRRGRTRARCPSARGRSPPARR